MPGVRDCRASAITGTVLLHFDPAVTGSEELLAFVKEAVQEPPDALPSSPEGGAEGPLESLAAAPGSEELPPPSRGQVRSELALAGALLAAVSMLLVATRFYGHRLAFDQVPLEVSRSLHSGPLTRLMLGASRLAETPVLVPLTLAATALGVGRRRPGDVPWVPPVAVGGGALLISSLKVLLRRQRPTAFGHLTHAPGYSLPSGHAASAMCLYGLLAHHGLRHLRSRHQSGRRAAAILLAGSVLALLAVGMSRVYLGVHYPTDVLAGYLVGVLWLWGLALLNDSRSVRT